MVEELKQGGVGGLNTYAGKIELVDDNLLHNEEFKKNVAIHYFKDIYKDLVQWSDNKTKGLNKVSILTVNLETNQSFSTLSFLGS
jgi:hypothetical protein